MDTLDDVDIDDDVDTELEVDTLKGMKSNYLKQIEKCLVFSFCPFPTVYPFVIGA